MLELRPTCEHCNKNLPPESTEARICSFECTFCASCVEQVLGNVCPNCGGGFAPRPVRPATNLKGDNFLGKYPASTTVKHRPVDPAAHAAFAATIAPRQPDERQAWHKRFAMQSNNRAWELSTMQRTPQQDQEMLDAAHASAWHWAKIGTELHQMRAAMCLAEVHALLGHGSIALAYAQDMRAYFLSHETPDWELAFTHAIHAHAAAAAGKAEEHRASYEAAKLAIAAIADEEDRVIVVQTFSQVPAP